MQEDEEVTLEETWLAMEECVKQGLAKSIGVSNFNSQQIDRILKIASIKPVVNQVTYTHISINMLSLFRVPTVILDDNIVTLLFFRLKLIPI